jgi:hypothetical protein
MTRRRFSVLSFGLLVVVILSSAANVQAQTFNLADDWSNLNNPNGPWALYKAPGVLFDVVQNDWLSNGTNQPAWSDALGNNPFPPNPHVPMWAKAVDDLGTSTADSVYAGFIDVGAVFMHSAEDYRTGTDFSSVVWTSPHAGSIQIDGGVWIAKAFDRPHTWELLKNGAVITSGSLTQSDPYDKTNPFAFAAGSGGASAVEMSVSAGDEIELLIYRPIGTLIPGTFVAVDLQIDLVPEPSSMLLATTLLAAVALKRTRM